VLDLETRRIELEVHRVAIGVNCVHLVTAVVPLEIVDLAVALALEGLPDALLDVRRDRPVVVVRRGGSSGDEQARSEGGCDEGLEEATLAVAESWRLLWIGARKPPGCLTPAAKTVKKRSHAHHQAPSPIISATPKRWPAV
jgi:hypothetical protein